MSILKKVIDSLFKSTKEYESKSTKLKSPVLRELDIDKARKMEENKLEKELMKSKNEENRNPLEAIVSKEEVHFKAVEEEEDHQRKKVESIVGAYRHHNIVNPNDEDEVHQSYLTHTHHRDSEGHYQSSSEQKDMYNQH